MRNAAPLILTLIPMALLGACVAPSERTPPPQPRPAHAIPTPTPPPASSPAPANTEWQYRPATPGDWTYRTEGAGSTALFGPANGAAMLSIHCDKTSHRISVARTGTGSGPITIRTSYGAVNWPASASTSATAQTIATRAANDSALDQIAYSRGRFSVEAQGLSPLILPAWAEIARVVEDCRG